MMHSRIVSVQINFSTAPDQGRRRTEMNSMENFFPLIREDQLPKTVTNKFDSIWTDKLIQWRTFVQMMEGHLSKDLKNFLRTRHSTKRQGNDRPRLISQFLKLQISIVDDEDTTPRITISSCAKVRFV